MTCMNMHNNNWRQVKAKQSRHRASWDYRGH